MLDPRMAEEDKDKPDRIDVASELKQFSEEQARRSRLEQIKREQAQEQERLRRLELDERRREAEKRDKK